MLIKSSYHPTMRHLTILFKYSLGVLSLALIIFLGCTAGAAKAQTKIMHIDQQEAAVLAYFKLGPKEPDYKKWLSTEPQYVHASSPAAAQNFLDRETQRLSEAYEAYDVPSIALTIKTDILVSYHPTGKNSSELIFTFPHNNNDKTDYVPFFPYPYGDEAIALIVSALGDFSKLSISGESDMSVRRHLKEPKVRYLARLSMQVIPTDADQQKEIYLEDKKYWIMNGDIIMIKCEVTDARTGHQDVLWQYTAPWHDSGSYYKDKSRAP